ncbi:something about silencing, SAS, complex subunit 4-domain-containing protein [Xylariaceae sp. FL0804]|nr:something about silencing, SAS, complex subunit 4-domain-containing protein [Xylariaceae sp. FL0804]
MAASTRRAEAYPAAAAAAAASGARHAQLLLSGTCPQQPILPHSRSARMKRPLDLIDSLQDPLTAKRARFAVELLARPPVAQPASPPTTLVAVTPQYPPAEHEPPSPTASDPSPRHPQPDTIATTAATEDNGLTRHREKVINGIRHELDRLQPTGADPSSAKDQSGRKLRSQEATRFKSELSHYFPEYDEVIGNEPREQHTLNADTPIVVFDSDPPRATAAATDTQLSLTHQSHAHTVRTYSDTLFSDIHDAQRVDFAFLEPRQDDDSALEDPLPDSHYAPSHRKAERLERSIRNTERGRAQHERDQIVRLLNALQGHDWLRTMGVNGVTESRKKTFEPARDHFIRGCQAILDKFRLWSREEKKRKLEKGRALAGEAEAAEEQKGEKHDRNDAGEGSDMDEAVGDADDAVDAEGRVAEGEPGDENEAAARQLHAEALASAKYTASGSSKRARRGRSPPRILQQPVEREFTSFFAKKHERDAALNPNRRRGRTTLAWGHPIPDMTECDFELPEEYLEADTLKAHERQKRRERRERRQ